AGLRVVLQQSVAAVWQLLASPHERAMVGDITPREIVLDRQWVRLAPQQRMGEQGFELGRKSQAAVRKRDHEQRLHPETVPGEEQRPSRAIVNREGKHSLEPRQALGPPMLPGGQYDLGVAVRPEGRAETFELAAQLTKIVDLAVEDDHGPPVR